VTCSWQPLALALAVGRVGKLPTVVASFRSAWGFVGTATAASPHIPTVPQDSNQTEFTLWDCSRRQTSDYRGRESAGSCWQPFAFVLPPAGGAEAWRVEGCLQSPHFRLSAPGS